MQPVRTPISTSDMILIYKTLREIKNPSKRVKAAIVKMEGLFCLSAENMACNYYDDSVR